VIRVVLPAHLRTLARVDGEVTLDVAGPATQRSVLDAFLRFFACEQDLTHEPPDAPLPDAVAKGSEPFLVVGAMAGG
jgi:sulfur-carrier protein